MPHAATHRPRDLVLVPFDWLGGSGVPNALAARLGVMFRLRARVDSRAAGLADCFDPVRGQYEAGRLLRRLGEQCGPDWVLGITSADLYAPVLTFVIGEACLGGRVAVVSTFRLWERADLPPSQSGWQRLVKEAVHELGHCHGLVHCQDGRCVMHASAVAEDVDLKSEMFCEECDFWLAQTDRSSVENLDSQA